MGTPRTMRSARWKREANSLIFSHVAVSTGVIDSPETPLYLALIASAPNSGSRSCQISNLSTVTSRTCSLNSERNALTIAEDADFSVAPGVTTFDTAGHTPGHMSVHISSGRKEMLLSGDVVVNSAVSFLHPEWPFGFDLDVPQATKTRMALLAAA
jgi:hypothetical protein